MHPTELGRAPRYTTEESALEAGEPDSPPAHRALNQSTGPTALTRRAMCSNREIMPALAFDTYKAVKALQAAGAAEPLAEAVVATVGEAVGGNVATKADLVEVQAGLETEIAATKAALESEIASVRAEVAEVRTDLAETKAELKTEIAEVRTEIAEVKAELKTEIAGVRTELKTELTEVKAELKTDIALLRADTEKGFQGVYKFMMVSTLAIISTIIGGAIALVRYLVLVP